MNRIILAVLLVCCSGMAADCPTLFRVAHFEAPDYPELARYAQIQGTVKVTIRLSPEGKIAWIQPAGPKLLMEEVERNLARWRFAPGVAEELKLTYDFRLENRKVTYKPVARIGFDLPDRVIISTNPPVPIYDTSRVKPKRDH